MTRYALTDAQWRRLEPLLPPERPRTGRPNHDHRTILDGILWVLRTGAPWRDLPERYGPVLLQLLDRLESSALFPEESCSFSQSDLHTHLHGWMAKARAQLID